MAENRIRGTPRNSRPGWWAGCKQPGCIYGQDGNCPDIRRCLKREVWQRTRRHTGGEHSDIRQLIFQETKEVTSMKKNNLVVKGMAMLMACAMVVGNTGIVAHATEYDDGCVRDDVAPGGGGSASLDDGGSSSSDSGSSSSSGSGSSSSGGGSSDSGSDYSGGGSGDSGNYSYDSSSGSSAPSGSGASYSAPAPKAAGTTAGVTGKETFRALAKAGAGTYKVTHKGIEIATFTLMDSEKNAVSCSKVALKQREDGKWAVNYEVADATGLTVGAPLDRTYMYNTLGVSYITINDTVIIDIEAEAAAK